MENKNVVKKHAKAKTEQEEALHKTTLKKRAMIEALKKTYGIVSHACKAIGIERSTHYGWIKEDPNYKAIHDSISFEDMIVDLAENALINKIEMGDTASILFALKCRGKKRGYVEKENILINNEHLQFELAQE